MRTFTIPTIFSAIDKFTGPINKMVNSTDAFERKMRKLGTSSLNVATKSAMVGAALAAPMAVAVNSAIKFEDKMADVSKTTGLQGEALDNFGNQILKMSQKTRTSIDDILKIAEIGGQLGIVKSELASFTEQADKFNVALGKDYSGGVEEAILSVAKLNNLFEDTRGLNITESISKAGSVINDLGAKGKGSSQNINDFILRIGSLPSALKPSFVATAALGAVMEENGVNAEIASSGYGRLISTAGEHLPIFAKAMNITTDVAEKLFAKDPSEFAFAFGKALRGIPDEKMPKVLEDLKIGSTEVQRVVGVLTDHQIEYNNLLLVSQAAMRENTSLDKEAATKMATKAAKLSILKNNMETLSITIGTMLLPVLNELVQIITPVIEKFVSFTKNNPGTVKAILKIALAASALAFAVSAISGGIFLYTKAAMFAVKVTKFWSEAQLVFNFLLSANPIGLIIIGIAALIGLVTLIIVKYNEWGAALTLILGPFGMIINLVQAFRRNWDLIKKSFSEGGILAGFKAIGATILDSILMPTQQLFILLSKLPLIGSKFASAAGSIQGIRDKIGVNTTTDESGNSLINPTQAKNAALAREITNTNNSKVDVNFSNSPYGMKAKSDNPGVSINIGSTLTPSLQ